MAPGITGIRLALASPHMGPYFGNTQTLNPTQNQIPTQHCLQVWKPPVGGHPSIGLGEPMLSGLGFKDDFLDLQNLWSPNLELDPGQERVQFHLHYPPHSWGVRY